MTVFGILMVRNEADVVRLSLLHHLSLGLDGILVVDNGSTDGTSRILEQMSRADERVRWSSNPGPYAQAEVFTELAREAFRQGAVWVVPFDADEFWWVKGGNLKAKLATSLAGALAGKVVNFIQRRDCPESSENALLTMTRRPPWPMGPGQNWVETGRIAWIEERYQPKWVLRPTAQVMVARGNHAVTGVAGEVAHGLGLVCLHAPLRSRACLERKADHGVRSQEAGTTAEFDWHLKRWARLRAADGLNQEWAANSYVDTSLDVYGQARPLVVDLRLRNAIAPFLGLAPESQDSEGAAPPRVAYRKRLRRRRQAYRRRQLAEDVGRQNGAPRDRQSDE